MTRYKSVGAAGNPRAHKSTTTKSPWLFEHIVIAERALGKALPPGAQVHHVDNNGRNNAGSNLVICQDAAYHKLLHVRERVAKGGGDPNTQKICSTCKEMKLQVDFYRAAHRAGFGIQSQCKACTKATSVGRVRRGRVRRESEVA